MGKRAAPIALPTAWVRPSNNGFTVFTSPPHMVPGCSEWTFAEMGDAMAYAQRLADRFGLVVKRHTATEQAPRTRRG
ncbi:hypothetical protein TomMM35A_18390 [Sphingobium sp. TomMM35A]